MKKNLFKLIASLGLCTTSFLGAEYVGKDVNHKIEEPKILDAKEVVVSYALEHPLHSFEAVSTAGHAKIVLGSSNNVKMQFQVDIKSFDSKNNSRDVNAQTVVEATKFSNVIFRGEGDLCDYAKKPCIAQINGELDFHGVKKKYKVPVTFTLEKGNVLLGHAIFHVSIKSHNIDPPKLMMMAINDDMVIKASAKINL